jgi:hypothetical protein
MRDFIPYRLERTLLFAATMTKSYRLFFSAPQARLVKARLQSSPCLRVFGYSQATANALILALILGATACQVRPVRPGAAGPAGAVDPRVSPNGGATPGPQSPDGHELMPSLVGTVTAGSTETELSRGVWNASDGTEKFLGPIALSPWPGRRAEVRISAHRPSFRGALFVEWLGAPTACSWEVKQVTTWDESNSAQTWILSLESPECGSYTPVPTHLRVKVPQGSADGLRGVLVIALHSPFHQPSQGPGLESLRASLQTGVGGSAQVALQPVLQGKTIELRAATTLRWAGGPPQSLLLERIDLPTWSFPSALGTLDLRQTQWALTQGQVTLSTLPWRGCEGSTEATSLSRCQIPIVELFRLANHELAGLKNREESFELRIRTQMKFNPMGEVTAGNPQAGQVPPTTWPVEIQFPILIEPESLSPLEVRINTHPSMEEYQVTQRPLQASASTQSLTLLEFVTAPAEPSFEELQNLSAILRLRWNARFTGLAPKTVYFCGLNSSSQEVCASWRARKLEESLWAPEVGSQNEALPFQVRKATKVRIELARYGRSSVSIEIPLRLPPEAIRWTWERRIIPATESASVRAGRLKIGKWTIENLETGPVEIEVPSTAPTEVLLRRKTYTAVTSTPQQLWYRMPIAIQEALILDGEAAVAAASSSWSQRLRVPHVLTETLNITQQLEFQSVGVSSTSESESSRSELRPKVHLLPPNTKKEIDVYILASPLLADLWAGRVVEGVPGASPVSILSVPVCAGPQYGDSLLGSGFCLDPGSCVSNVSNDSVAAETARSLGACLACQDGSIWSCFYCELSQTHSSMEKRLIRGGNLRPYCREDQWRTREIVVPLPQGVAYGPVWIPNGKSPKFRLRRANTDSPWFEASVGTQDQQL